MTRCGSETETCNVGPRACPPICPRRSPGRRPSIVAENGAARQSCWAVAESCWTQGATSVTRVTEHVTQSRPPCLTCMPMLIWQVWDILANAPINKQRKRQERVSHLTLVADIVAVNIPIRRQGVTALGFWDTRSPGHGPLVFHTLCYGRPMWRPGRLPPHVLDAKCACLNGHTRRRIQIELPAQDPRTKSKQKMGRLVKAMYGTRDAPRIWGDGVKKEIPKQG